jgi:hypothetical protein
MALTQVPPALLTSTTGTGSTVVLSASPTFTGTVTTPGVTFSDASSQTAAASPYVLKNRIINGDMRIDQRNAGASTTPTTTATNVYNVDRWFVNISQASKFSIQQNAGSVTPPAGFTNYLGATSLSAYTAGASDYFTISQNIEGYNISDLAWGTVNAKTVTFSFWVRSSLTGTFGGSFLNSASNRSYPFTYTISSANTWEQKTITVAGDTTGTWLTTNGIGINVNFSLGMGSTYSGTSGAWASAAYFSATGATSVVGTNGATFYITGVQLEQNTSATPFERRLYNQELANCQRYCFVYRPSTNYAPYLMAHGISTTAMRGLLKFPQTMRTSPSLTFTAANTFQWSYGNVATSIALAEQGVDMSSVDIGSTGTSANGGYMITSANTTSSSIIGSAEL